MSNTSGTYEGLRGVESGAREGSRRQTMPPTTFGGVVGESAQRITREKEGVLTGSSILR